ncbi:MAG: glycosyltransferase family 2 protein [Lachnospiraceae bacterium]|nr:glycosyltransferase family 2 protein [Lachnospiraceae bacterium]
MSKSIGIVVCNFNKQDYVVKCLQSLFESTMPTSEFDVYVVDNASTDDSVKMIKEQFDGKVTLIVNSENLGGSGGFNTGLSEALKGDYRYLMCVDNDIVFDREAIEKLYDFLEYNPDVAVAGSKAYFMDEPEKIWNYGGRIDFHDYIQKDCYKNVIETGDLPEVVYCDYVPACSLMARTEAVRKVGIMPEDNFIYWDDMEWGYRFHLAGYKVASYGLSKVWHKAGGRNAGNTFIHYYMWRNRIHFFMDILPEIAPDESGNTFCQSVISEYNGGACRSDFAVSVLSEMFRMIYSVNLKGEKNIVRTLMYAFDDAVHGVRGKARDGMILDRPAVPNRLKEAIAGKDNVLISFNGYMEGLGNIIKNIRSFSGDMQIAVATQDAGAAVSIRNQYPDIRVEEEYAPEKYTAHLVMCDHIFKLTTDMPKDHYIDPWCNLIYSAEDFIYASSFEQTKELFVLCKKELLSRMS